MSCATTSYKPHPSSSITKVALGKAGRALLLQRGTPLTPGDFAVLFKLFPGPAATASATADPAAASSPGGKGKGKGKGKPPPPPPGAAGGGGGGLLTGATGVLVGAEPVAELKARLAAEHNTPTPAAGIDALDPARLRLRLVNGGGKLGPVM